MKTSNEAGVTGRLRQRLYLALAALGIAGIFGAVAYAVHDLGIFELEGNAVIDSTGDDWVQIYCDEIDPDRTGVCSVGSGDPKLDGTPASNALVSVFAFDPFSPNADDVFTQGGSKDSRDISEWQWKIGGATNKADLEHAYAALYRDPVSMDFILYFGTDRLANNGDAALGFWFTQDEVTMEGDGDGASPIGGTHTDGDILIQTDWPQAAGAVPRIEAYTWDSNCTNADPDCVAPSQGGLKRISSIAGTTCDTAGAGDDLCAVANPGDPDDNQVGVELAPWPYTFKAQGGNEARDAFPSETFFEGGINLSAVFPDGIPCISTFVAETRVSNSETAQLDDKLIAGFDLCSVKVEKEGPALAKVGDPATYTITITNDGALPLTQVSVVDDVLGDLTGLSTTGDCINLDTGASCTIEVSRNVMMGDPDPLNNTVTVLYMRGGDEVTGTASHEVNLFTPDVTLDKKADGSDGPVTIDQGAVVDYSVKVTNTSSDDTPNLSCDITDNEVNGGLNQMDVVFTPNEMKTFTQSVAFNFPTANPFTWCSLQIDGTFLCKNTADVLCSPDGFTNEVDAMDMVEVIVVPAQVLLTVLKEGDAFGKVGDPVDYTITITNNNDIEAVTLTSIVDTLLGDLTDGTNAFITMSDCPVAPATLAPLASCTINATRDVMMGDGDPLPNEVTVQGEDQFGNAGTAIDDHSVDLVAPSYTLSKSCVQEPVTIGQFANFMIDIVNDGDVNLVIDVSDPDLGIDEMDVTLGERGGVACGDADFDPTGMGIGADAADGCLRFEEGVLVTQPGDIENTVDVFATLPVELELPNMIDESAGDTCTVEVGEVTRTWGFWKTHGSDGQQFDPPVDFGFTCYVLENPLGGVMDLGWKTVTECGQLFDIFWSSKAKNSDGSKRGKLCQVKLQASRQLAAAILNTGLGTPGPGTAIEDLIAELDGQMRRRVIIDLMGDLAAFNESGDDAAIETDVEIPHADPRGTRLTAEEGFSDCN